MAEDGSLTKNPVMTVPQLRFTYSHYPSDETKAKLLEVITANSMECVVDDCLIGSKKSITTERLIAFTFMRTHIHILAHLLTHSCRHGWCVQQCMQRVWVDGR